VTAADSVAIDELLLGLKIGFLVLLYLFIWRIVRTASRDIRTPQESVILSPAQAAAAGLARRPGRLVVVRSTSLKAGRDWTLDSTPLTIGRGGRNDIELRGDDFASALHARFEPRADGVWVEDAGSTNGTFVNGARIEGARRLRPGDVVRVGETDLRYER
jgi:pSer/pThr/pTyr-binding forkhead associated (FHA) protein